MNREDALKKIKKCLAVGASNSPDEAAIALRQAQKLMSEHRITEHDISMADVLEVRVRTASGGSLWDVALSNTVADSFGCERFVAVAQRVSKSFEVQTIRENVFVGIGAAPAVGAYAYQVLSRQCAKARLSHIRLQSKNCRPITKTTRGDVFAEGWVQGVRRVIERFAQPAQDDVLLLSYMAARYPDLRSVQAKDRANYRKVDWGHRSRGFELGSKARLDHGIATGGPQERLRNG